MESDDAAIEAEIAEAERAAQEAIERAAQLRKQAQEARAKKAAAEAVDKVTDVEGLSTSQEATEEATEADSVVVMAESEEEEDEECADEEMNDHAGLDRDNATLANAGTEDFEEVEEVEEENEEWAIAREKLKAELDSEEEVTLVLTAYSPASIGELLEEVVELDESDLRDKRGDAFEGCNPPASWEEAESEERQVGPIVNLSLFNSRTNIHCKRRMLNGTKVIDQFADAMLNNESIGPNQVSLNSSRRVVIELDGGSVRADVGAVAEAVAALCSGDMPEIEHWDLCCATLLAAHVLGHRLATAKTVQQMSQNLRVETITQTLRCAEGTQNARLLKLVFYFLRGHFIANGTQGILQLLDGEIRYVVTGERAPTWSLTTAAMDVERRLEATGSYSLDPELRKCYVQRIKGTNGMPDRYSMFAEGTMEFLLSAHKISESVHILSLSRLESSDVSEGNDDYVGRIEANFLGTKFHIFDHGIDPEVIDPTSFPARPRLVLATCHYESNRVITLPREMTVTIGDQSPTEIENVSPRWNEAAGCYMLNFGGRVKKASVKNFILAKADAQDHTLMLFGKVTSDRFSLDFRAPLSPAIAFGIALSSLTRKKAVT